MHDPLRERAAFVRAAIVQREDLVVGGAEDRDRDPTQPDNAGTKRRNRVERADIGPVR